MKHLTYLSLEGCISLEGLPREIGSLESLKELNLLNTRIVELPDSIGKLKKINVVRMERSKMKELPLAMEMAEKLEELQESQSMENEEVRIKDEAKQPVALIGNSYMKSPHVAKECLVGIDKKWRT
ncbi:hypothetical protein NL676_033192 [Syzygium grande]|nr:hypothetical protein NL676_033192 [Syzygium grande]